MDLLIVLLLAVLPLSGCDDTVNLKSQWRTRPITIDGSGADWSETGQYLDEKSRVLISVMNDEDNIYVRLLLRSKESQMMFLRAGAITWIDDAGGTRKKFGVQFPLAKQNHFMRGTMRDYKPRNSMQDLLEDSKQTLSILKSQEDCGQVPTIFMSEAAEMGVYVSLGMEADYMIYELQVPCRASAGNKIVGIGFETGKTERPFSKERPAGGGEMTKGNGGPSRGGDGGIDSERGRSESIEMWAMVQLAHMP
ncbi:MAG: hypothetical protein KKD01_02455 [Proteobacteria bacterium]|nr:hypothetical protein [Pseudomonadota bacterium]MBU1416854.1 hypothetical protein [Pseudomonadota bacterium]MBU1453563.1 hypothetical protein [Pseudomonadota bacterium]